MPRREMIAVRSPDAPRVLRALLVHSGLRLTGVA
jgi:hypothetical protein